jgi:predicted GNAT family N-acyltransferase
VAERCADVSFFEPEGEAHLEDGIPHIGMTLTPGRGPLT